MGIARRTIYVVALLALVVFVTGIFQAFPQKSFFPVVLLGVGWFSCALFSLKSRLPVFLAATVLGGAYCFDAYSRQELLADGVALGLLVTWAMAYLLAVQVNRGDLWAVIMVGSAVLLIEQAVFSLNLWLQLTVFLVLLAVGQGLLRHSSPASGLRLVLLLFVSLPLLLLLWLPEKVQPAANELHLEQVVKYDGSSEIRVDNAAGETVELPLFVVESSKPSYWRGRVYDYYDGRQWHSTLESAPGLQPQFAERLYGMELQQSITLFAEAEFLPAAYQAIAVSDQAVSIDRAGSIIKDTREMYRYQVTSILPDLAKVSPGGADRQVDRRYLQLPDNFSPAIRKLAQEITRESGNNWEKALLIRDYLRQNYTYNTRVNFNEGEMVARFLFSEKQGYCVQFATAMVMLARSVGIPARWVLGFTPGVYDVRQGAYLVYGRNAHTWAEVYVPGNGWLPVEATPGFALPELNVEESGTGQVLTGYGFTGQGFGMFLLMMITTAVGLYVIFSVRRRSCDAGKGAAEHWTGTGLYGEMARWFQQRGKGPAPHETPVEFGNRIAGDFPQMREIVKAVVENFISWRYGGKKFAVEEERELRQQWETWRQNSTKKK